MYEVQYSRQARSALRRMPRDVAGTIERKIAALAANPSARNNNVTALKGEPGYRLRIGDWRIVYELHHDILVIVVIKIASRGSVNR